MQTEQDIGEACFPDLGQIDKLLDDQNHEYSNKRMRCRIDRGCLATLVRLTAFSGLLVVFASLEACLMQVNVKLLDESAAYCGLT